MSTSTSRRASASSRQERQVQPRHQDAQTARPPSPHDCEAKVSVQHNGKTSWFTSFAQKTAHLAGRPITFLLAAATIVVWAVTGPLFGYSDTWQLVINTGTTIVTFLMVFLIQNSQNRDALAFQVKLDELIIKLQGAGNEIAGAEDLCDEDLEALHEAYRKRAAQAHDTLEKRRAVRGQSAAITARRPSTCGGHAVCRLDRRFATRRNLCNPFRMTAAARPSRVRFRPRRAHGFPRGRRTRGRTPASSMPPTTPSSPTAARTKPSWSPACSM